jgi:small subunit ribosomal protein S9
MATTKKYYYAVGRRKMATAVVKLFPQGSGQYIIRKENKEVSLKDFFGGNEYMYIDATYPFAILGNDALAKYDAEIIVRGGGLMGQAEAMRLGFSRALVELDEQLRPTLKPYGMLKRDPRIKERKKPGLKKARKSGQWSKR